MKKLILAGALTMFLLSGAAIAGKIKHPHLHAAHDQVMKALTELTLAEKDNPKGVLGDHAQKARDLLTQAEAEMKAAVEEADKAEDKPKK